MWVKFVKIGTYELFKVGLEAQWLQPYPPYRTHKVVQHMHVGTVGEPNHMDASGASPPVRSSRPCMADRAQNRSRSLGERIFHVGLYIGVHLASEWARLVSTVLA
jgi:hypothetical protein